MICIKAKSPISCLIELKDSCKSHLVKNILVNKKGFSTSHLMKIFSFVWPQPMFFGIQTHKWSYIVTCVDYLENVNVWYWSWNFFKKNLNEFFLKKSRSSIVLTWWNLNLNPIKWNKDKHVFVLICYFWQDPIVFYWIKVLLPWSNSNYICVCYQMSLNIA